MFLPTQANARDPIHVRQGAEWFSFSNTTHIECTLAAAHAGAQNIGGAAADVSVTLATLPRLEGAALDRHLEDATRGNMLDRMTGGCEHLDGCKILKNDYKFVPLDGASVANASHCATYGHEFEFEGVSHTLAGAYAFTAGSTPEVSRVSPAQGMPGADLEIFGRLLDTPTPDTVDNNWYMSRQGFFQQPAAVEVFVGKMKDGAPCAVLQHNATYIRCVLWRNTLGTVFPVTV